MGNCGGNKKIFCTFEPKKQKTEKEMRFIGNIEAKTDAKGRAFLPAQFRKVLQANGEERIVMKRDVFQQCLVLYPESVWNARIDELNGRLSVWNAKHQMIIRQFMSNVEVLSLDSSGRFLISAQYRKAANINQELRFVGMGDVIEVWNNDELNKTMMDQNAFSSELETLMADNINGSGKEE